MLKSSLLDKQESSAMLASDGDEETPTTALPLLDVRPVHCRVIPGHFILRCYRREIHFTWIPPNQPIKKAMIKFKQSDEKKYTTMSDYGWGHSAVGIRNNTLAMLKPNTVYEFGINLIYQNDTFGKFPPTDSLSFCACKTHADVPEMPEDVRYHYLHGNAYSLEWTPGTDNGDPIISYDLKTMTIQDQLNNPAAKWQTLNPYNLTANRLNFTLDTHEHSTLQLRAINKIGAGYPAYVTVEPPIRTVPDHKTNLASVFEPLNHVTGILTYSLLSVGLVLLFLLMFVIFMYRRRKTDLKAGKHPFLINFHTRRMHSGSGIDSFGLGGGSDLTTSGIPLDLSTLDPLWNQEVNSLYGMGKSDLISFEQVPQISAANIRFQRYIGCGAFGKVWEGWYHVNDADGDRFEKVALKVRNIKSLTEAEFRREATLMHRYQHANIVRFFGVSFDSPGQQCLVLEMMDQGNLRDYLHRARPRLAPNVAANMFAAAAICAAGSSAAEGRARLGSEGSSMNTSTTSTAGGCGTTTASNVITLTAQLDLPALLTIMRDISHGCRYLEEQHFVHRDIAARNCLVSHNHPSGRIVKLCDFGLARDIYKNDCYRKRNEPKLPVRWMSPEAIRDGLFTTKSDVWAFAVTCWEVLTLGADPFYGRANLDVMNLVIGGHVLGRPENCPEELYNQMLQCWSRFTEMRPSFGDLAKKMDEFVQLSADSGSPFSGPFIVSLPLPKSLPDPNGLPMFTCNRDEMQLGNVQDFPKESSSTQCIRRPSLNEFRTGEQMGTNRRETRVMSDQLTQDTSEDLAKNENEVYQASHGGNSSREPLVKQQPNETNPEHVLTIRPNCPYTDTLKKSYQLTSNAAYERAPSEPSTEQTTVMHTTGTDGLPTSSMNSQAGTEPPSNSVSGNVDGDKRNWRLTLPPDYQNRPISLFNSSSATSPSHKYDMQPSTHKTLNYHAESAQHGLSISCTRSMSTAVTNTTSPTSTDNVKTSGPATEKSVAAYWLVETGGGVDSLGYERPSWTSAYVKEDSRLQTSSLRFPTGSNHSSARPTPATLRSQSTKPRVVTGALSG
ncbi:unnamed protein product [Calicophoron daubneyi]|uniref:receptor protein-tyrosine kinase n=3 Tax=Calicophoron daubneyi TaxID=300641 RepID=A0AAV2TFC4_CALDB